MTYEAVATDFDELCKGRSGPEIVELVLERHPDHRGDSLLTLFCCTYAKVHGGTAEMLHEPGRARVRHDYLHYVACGQLPDQLPVYFVRCLLPQYIGGPA